MRTDSQQLTHAQAASVFVVDEDLSVRDMLESLIRAAGWCVQSFASAEEFLLHRRDMRPGCLVMDLAPQLLDEWAFEKIVADRKVTPIIFVTAFRDIAMAVRAMKAGAVDFLTKPIRTAAG